MVSLRDLPGGVTLRPGGPSNRISMIKVEGLTKRYARHVAVKNISFEVGKGEIVGFLGKNGAGKTTTMRVLTCFLPPTAGKASVAGFDVLDQSIEVKKRIGYLPETPPLYPEMEVSTYLTFVSRLKGIPSGDIRKRVDEVCERTAIADVKDTIVGKLSKGYRQRVGLAQAIIHNPPVLILDEPTSGLDPEQQREARQLISSLSGDHTIILSTHILSEVEQSCSKVIIINNGEIVVSDTVENLHRRRSAAESVLLGVAGAPAPQVRQKLEQVSGVASVITRDTRDGANLFEVQALENFAIRPELARAVVQSGWNLTELRAVGQSLEEIFLELTKSETASPDSSEPGSTKEAEVVAQ
jgi:ABC-2 type transport system ATP-binding protein